MKENSKIDIKKSSRFSKSKEHFAPKHGFFSTSRAGEIRDGRILISTNFITQKTIRLKNLEQKNLS